MLMDVTTTLAFLRWKIFPFYPCDYRDPGGSFLSEQEVSPQFPKQSEER